MVTKRNGGTTPPQALCSGVRFMKARKSAKAMPNDNLPSFDNPPLIETVIGVQFDQIATLTRAFRLVLERVSR